MAQSPLFVCGQFLDEQVPILDFGVGAAVDLQGDDAVVGNGFVALGVIDCLDAVEPKLNVGALRTNPVVVPLARSERLRSRLLFGLGDVPVSPAFIVQITIRVRAEIGL